MNDIWRELEERLKQKAFLHGRTAKGKEPVCSMYPDNVGYAVWLEDVKSAIQQLKQSILDEIIELIYRRQREIGLEIVDGLGVDVTESFIQDLKELLWKNEG